MLLVKERKNEGTKRERENTGKKERKKNVDY
jgi:hypothetical protein